MFLKIVPVKSLTLARLGPSTTSRAPWARSSTTIPAVVTVLPTVVPVPVTMMIAASHLNPPETPGPSVVTSVTFGVEVTMMALLQDEAKGSRIQVLATLGAKTFAGVPRRRRGGDGDEWRARRTCPAGAAAYRGSGPITVSSFRPPDQVADKSMVQRARQADVGRCRLDGPVLPRALQRAPHHHWLLPPAGHQLHPGSERRRRLAGGRRPCLQIPGCRSSNFWSGWSAVMGWVLMSGLLRVVSVSEWFRCAGRCHAMARVPGSR